MTGSLQINASASGLLRVIGVALLVGGLVWVGFTLNFVVKADRTTGKIVDVWTDYERSYHYSVEFVAPSGVSFEVESRVTQDIFRPRRGDRVPVL